MREVSQRLGVSHTAAYRHFKNKHALLCAVAEYGFHSLADGSEALVARHIQDDPLAALVAMGQGYVGFALANPALYRLMFGPDLTVESRPPSLQAAAARAYGILPELVARCQAQGQLRSGSSLVVASVLWSLMHGMVSLFMDGQLQTDTHADGRPIFVTDDLGRPQNNTDRLMDLMVEVMLLGLAQRPDAAQP
jgi:AcrR family transcriptional regulator